MHQTLVINVAVYGILIILFGVLAAKNVRATPRTDGAATQWLEPNLFHAFTLFFMCMLAFKLADHFLSFFPFVVVLLIGTVLFFLLANRYNYRVGIREEGLLYRRWKEIAIPWNEIRSVRFSYPKKGWIISTEKNGDLLVPTFLSGLPALFEAFQKHRISYQ